MIMENNNTPTTLKTFKLSKPLLALLAVLALNFSNCSLTRATQEYVTQDHTENISVAPDPPPLTTGLNDEQTPVIGPPCLEK